jgi:hypothetical protein
MKRTYLGEGRFILCNDLILELDSLTLDGLLLLFLLVIILLLLDLLLDTSSLLVSLQPSFEDSLYQVISSEDLVSLDVLDHPICEFVDVA